jgi:hypothetical protein
MILELTFNQFILIPFIFTLVGLLACWLYYAFRHPLGEKPARVKIYRCQVCEHVYLDQREVPLARCSRCGCLNEAVKR